YSYDRFLPGYQQLYKAELRFNNNGQLGVGGSTSLPLEGALKNEIPEIKYVAHADWMGPHGLVVNNTKLYLEGAMVGQDFLKMFQYPLLKGSAESILQDPYSIVLTESTATSLFGNEDPINKMVRIDNNHDLKVTGVLKNLPDNSTFRFNYIV